MNRNKTITIRVNPDEFEKIKTKSENKGMSISKFVAENALAEKGLTASQQREIYRHLLIIKDYVFNSNMSKEMIDKVELECNEICQF